MPNFSLSLLDLGENAHISHSVLNTELESEHGRFVLCKDRLEAAWLCLRCLMNFPLTTAGAVTLLVMNEVPRFGLYRQCVVIKYQAIETDKLQGKKRGR